ncbi:cadherin-like domain-containing protein [Candidatus Bipolaricaulota bacterium]|nr:cadherin-like domain-containing protein [Candidatus Bipolaricaulota bacterium]
MTALLKALGKTLNTVVGVAIPSIGITRNNPIEATVMVTGCELRCPREGQRLMVISVIESKGTTRSRDGMLELPEVETVIASRGPTILDARHPSEVTGDELDDEGAIWSGFTISGGNTVTSLSLLFGLAEFDAYSSNRENYLKSLSEEDLKSIPALTVQEAGIATVVPYCGCIDETASAEEIEEIVVDVINKAPQPAFQPIIEISLTGATQVPRAFQASDPEDDPLWVYVKMEMLSSEGLQVAVNQVTGAATFRTHELSDEMREILLQRRQRRVEVYLYDLKPDAVIVAGTEPTEEQYHNKIGPVAVTLRFTASKPPEAIDVHEYLDAEALRAQGCRIKALFRAYDDDPEGLIHGHRVWFELDLEKTADELQHVASDLYPICTAKGICEGRAFFTTRDAASCLSQSFEALPPVGDYEIGFTVYEANAQGQALFSDTGTYTLTIVSTPPVAQDDNFILRSNAAGDSRSIVCAVLANDRDPDGGVLLAIEIVEAPLHGAAVINDDLTITYTSDEGHGGEDAFTYRVSDVTKTERKDTDWSNEAAVAVKTVTPPAALDMTVRGHPNPETVSEEYAGPWVLSFDAQNPLLLTAVDLDAVSVKDYEFRVGISPENSPGVTFVSIGNDYTPGGLICKDLGCTYDANVNRISFTAPASINGPKSLLPPIFGWSIMRFSFTIIDPDGQESAPGILTVMAGNSPPQGESIQLRTISFRFGEPMIRALEPAWYEAGCLSFTDPDGDPLTFSISRPPRKGRAGLSNTRLDPGVYAVTIMYEIDRDEALLDHTDEEPFVDHLTVEAKDPFGATAETLVEITVDVINSNPVCVDDEVTTPMETAIEFDVLLNDSDVDGDELKVLVVGSAGDGIASCVGDSTRNIAQCRHTRLNRA